MKRNEFLSLLPALTLPLNHRPVQPGSQHLHDIIVPPYLKPGDTIALTSSAGYITAEEVQPARQQMESWGFRVQLGSTIGKRDNTFGGTDDERYRDLQSLLDNKNVQAIMCARGGYGVNRILDRLDLSIFKKHPKWVIGFSDITALHLHLLKQANIASIHSKMCNSFPREFASADAIVQDTILSIRNALNGSVLIYRSLPDANNRKGKAEGILTGGNLAIIASMMSTPSEIETDGRILFLEEVGEYLYSLDRMMTTLQRAGKLSKLKGLVVGGFNRIKTDDPGEEFGHTIQEIILSKVSSYQYPVCFGFPVGHQKDNFALRHGMVHGLEVTEAGAVLVSH
jgi:muramoyltetrapeptide carboxypeptidase